jgi:ferredoxin--NADP+ reductase
MEASDAKQLRIAIVGAGASGLMAARELLTHDAAEQIDLFDQAPEPWGLIGHGTAPDHPDRARQMTILGPTLADARVQFHPERRLGADLQRDELRANYDAVIYATGAPRQRPLNVPGEQLRGSIAAQNFFDWYTGRPGAAEVDLDGVQEVVVVGLGDVGIDVARMLLKNPADFTGTPMAPAAQAELRHHRVRQVTILVRRGPRNIDVKPPDLAELVNLPGVRVEVDQTQLGLYAKDLDSKTRANLEVLAAIPRRLVPKVNATLRILFWHRPVAIVGDGQVTGVRLEESRLAADGTPVGTGSRRDTAAQLVIAATGFIVDSIPGLPYDELHHVVPTMDDRLVSRDGEIQPHEYVTGWAKRGAKGGFGTARRDAAGTVAHLISDLT